MDLSREEFLSRYSELRDDMLRGFDGVNAKLDKQNGRVGQLESDRAVHNQRISVLETTDADNRRDARMDKRIALALSVLTVGATEGLKAGWHALSGFFR